MPRKPRLEYEGALYHVISRGNGRQKIFFKDSDYQKYLSFLEEYRNRYGFKIFAFVLMPNHIHLLIEQSSIPLSRLMQRLNSRYCLSFNKKYRREGHVLQGRYKAILCEKETYLLELTRYLHLNPVRGNIVQDPENYPWSSFRSYLGKEETVKLETEDVLNHFGETSRARALKYRSFVLGGIKQHRSSKFYSPVEGQFLGSEGFIERLRANSGLKEKLNLTLSTEELVNRVGRFFGCNPKEMKGPGKDRRRAEARMWAAYLGRKFSNIRPSDLAKELEVDPSCISQCVRRMEEKTESDENRAIMTQLEEMIRSVKYQV